ncbi:transferase [Tsukamurella conjunctivitidis]|uniref:Transferase n=2 Tax=Tsukamurella TaxID=2060 RepID=A0A5C5RTU0_9ACTN|nr:MULTISPECIES: transferase [Tsukamurella]RDB47232.1 transferase [Tsukamurella tyrosinosolvens]TWS25641.1 transferase [Tsukamurella conjunctivitidis]
MSGCRGCGEHGGHRVLDVGAVPAADHFPPVDEPISAAESAHPLAMDLCPSCGLAQLADDDTVTEEPRGVEPAALREQAADAVARVAAAGYLSGTTVREFGSPHGGTWLPLLGERGFAESTLPADVVLDCFGIMHEPDQRAAFARRAAATAPDGVLLLQFHSLTAIVAGRQWNALRHGHFAYYSLTSVRRLLAGTGMRLRTAWEFDLYGGTVLVAAEHGDGTQPVTDPALRLILAAEAASGITTPDAVSGLGRACAEQVRDLRAWAREHAAAGRRAYAYGAASRAVALFALAGVDRSTVAGVADASPAKQGRRMPGTDIPIISPDELIAARPDTVFLTVPDLRAEVAGRYPELAHRLTCDPRPERTSA